MIEIHDNQRCLQQIVESFNKIREAKKLLTGALRSIDMEAIRPEARFHIFGMMQLERDLSELRETYESDILEIDNA